MKLIAKTLIAIFLAIGVVAHVYGLIAHAFNEPDWSHAVHIFSYSLCLFTFLRPVKFRLLIYGLAAAYPFVYHVRCFFVPLFERHQFNHICLEVIIVLPLAAWFIISENRPTGLGNQ